MEAWVQTEHGPFPFKEKYLMLYSIRSQHLYCFRHRGCWNHRPFGPYFKSLLANLQCSKKQGLCLLQVSNTHTPYSSEFYGHVLQEGITSPDWSINFCTDYWQIIIACGIIYCIYKDLCTVTTLIPHNDNPDAVPSFGKFQTAHGSGCSIPNLSTRGLSQT